MSTYIVRDVNGNYIAEFAQRAHAEAFMQVVHGYDKGWDIYNG